MIVVTLLGLPTLLLAVVRPRIFGGSRLRGAMIGLAMIVGGFVGFGLTRQPRDDQVAAPPAAQPQAVVAAAPQAPPQAPPAPAMDRQPPQLRNTNGQSVFIWRDSDRMSEGFRMINAGVHQTNPGLVMQQITCVVPNGTDIVVSSGGWMSSAVTVVAGPQSGCRGVVPNEMIERRR
jgi:hypothetical protein